MERICVFERECVYVRGTEKERELVSVCVCVSVSVCVLECIRQRESVCVCRGTGSRNGVEGRGLELRVEGWRMYELESEYEITRRRYSSSLLIVVTRVT